MASGIGSIQAGSSSLIQISKINALLTAALERAGSGTRISRSSQDPSGFFASKIAERDIRLAEVSARNLEREQSASNTKLSRLDSAVDLAVEIELLASQAQNTVLQGAEKDALQKQITQLASQLDTLLQDNNLGTAADLGLDASSLVVNGSSADAASVKQNASSALTSLLGSSVTEGIKARQSSRQLANLGQEIVDLKATKSTLVDADLAEEASTIQGLSLLQQTSIQSFSNQINSAKSILDLLG